MRLLNVETKMLEEFFGADIPGYAILSHTWGPNEVTFEDIQKDGYKPGTTRKIDGCIGRAKVNHCQYIWIDTCCINKSSSAELSEAINSMWEWYKAAERCYVYLSDVEIEAKSPVSEEILRKSRWFTRGWTLQELIAPRYVEFFDNSWFFLGSKGGNSIIGEILPHITGIPEQVLTEEQNIGQASIAQKMSWAASRTTTRAEDVAYCLLGIFGVNMPLLYGEGARAFIRLQEEIIKSSDDESIFAGGFTYTPKVDLLGTNMLFASSPADFINCKDVVGHRLETFKSSHYSLTNKGLHVEMSICNLPKDYGTSLGYLNSTPLQERNHMTIALPITSSTGDSNTYYRLQAGPVLVSRELFQSTTGNGPSIYLHRGRPNTLQTFYVGFGIRCLLFSEDTTFKTTEIYPPGWRGVFKYRYPSTICHRGDLRTQQQSIVFLCEDVKEWPKFAVKIDYKFQLYDDRWHLNPRGLHYYAAFVRGSRSLAELLIADEAGKETELALDWRERLYFQNEELTFRVGQLLSGDWILNIEIDLSQNLPLRAATQPLSLLDPIPIN
jgi:hypothetical protein